MTTAVLAGREKLSALSKIVVFKRFGLWRQEFMYSVIIVSDNSLKLHCVSKNVPPLQLAIIFTYTVRLRQFLAQMLPRKQAIKIYFIFPPHLTSASALPGET